ncbi:MAG: hypothetical protein JWN80_3011, partial [Microbacteriaceae bacterium]|nr:hypothetical protein [Microbacteriaceae bacterium]
RVSVQKAGSRPIDLVRAGAAAIWGADIGIHSLTVDPALYEGSF